MVDSYNWSDSTVLKGDNIRTCPGEQTIQEVIGPASLIHGEMAEDNKKEVVKADEVSEDVQETTEVADYNLTDENTVDDTIDEDEIDDTDK